MKKIFIFSLGLVIILLSSFTILSKSSKNSIPDPDKQQLHCVNQFNSKCLQGGSVDLTNFYTLANVEAYCASNANSCSYSECVTRLRVILDLGTTINAKGNPCLPKEL